MHRLVVFRNLLNDSRVKLLMDLLDKDSIDNKASVYYELCSLVTKNDDKHLLEIIIEKAISDENPFSINAERNNIISNKLHTAVISDIKILKELCSLDLKSFSKSVDDKHDVLNLGSSGTYTTLFSYNEPEQIYDFLYNHYSDYGCGEYYLSKVFAVDETLKLVPVSNFVPTEIDDLYGYENQKEDIIENTARFISGLPAQNILLFGDSGTGKSTMVKSMIPRFSQEKLRLVEVDKDKLHALPEIMSELSKRGLFFIIFIDDLSFEYNDEEYKYLKTIIQGGLYENVQNVRFYVTSNRRNIVKQDMDARAKEVNVNDYLNETVSLTDRFGMKIYFDKPVKSEYVEMVYFIAKNKNVALPKDYEKAALQFAFYNGGYNGRSARQFINSITL